MARRWQLQEPSQWRLGQTGVNIGPCLICNAEAAEIAFLSLSQRGVKHPETAMKFAVKPDAVEETTIAPEG